jgi:hypothetical protein
MVRMNIANDKLDDVDASNKQIYDTFNSTFA